MTKTPISKAHALDLIQLYGYTVKNFTRENWPEDAPPYDSAEGWEYEKALKLKQLKAQALISWFSKQGTQRHCIIANRLKEINIS